MKKVIALLLALIMCLSLAACGEMGAIPAETEPTDPPPLTKDDLLAQAKVVYADEITSDIGGNQAKASTYKGAVYQITGHVHEVNEEYCILAAARVETDQHVHRDNWIDYGCDTVFHVYLPLEDLAELELCSNIMIVGEITDVALGQYHAIDGQIQLSITNAYLLKTDVKYNGTSAFAD